MTLLDTIRALMTKRAQLATELSAVDQELAEARTFFVELDAPAATPPTTVIATPVERPHNSARTTRKG